MKINRCQYCGTEKFYYFHNGVMVMSNCINNCIGSLKIFQYGEDEYIIYKFKKMGK